MGTANCGITPLSMTFTRLVKADRRRDPASAEPCFTNERIWPGRRPSGPPEAPARKDKIAFLIPSSVATAGTTDPSGGLGRLRFSGAEGCFSFNALRVSPSCGAKPSANASSLTDPLTSPSANLAATLLFRVQFCTCISVTPCLYIYRYIFGSPVKKYFFEPPKQ